MLFFGGRTYPQKISILLIIIFKASGSTLTSTFFEKIHTYIVSQLHYKTSGTVLPQSHLINWTMTQSQAMKKVTFLLTINQGKCSVLFWFINGCQQVRMNTSHEMNIRVKGILFLE